MPGTGSSGNAVCLTCHQKELANRIISTEHFACDVGDLHTALQLLRVVALIIKPGTSAKRDSRQVAQHAVMAHERLWLLRFPGTV